jgi:hypothetical protein
MLCNSIKHFKNLETLWLGRNRIDNQGYVALAELCLRVQQLTKVDLSGNISFLTKPECTEQLDQALLRNQKYKQKEKLPKIKQEIVDIKKIQNNFGQLHKFTRRVEESNLRKSELIQAVHVTEDCLIETREQRTAEYQVLQREFDENQEVIET